MNKHIELVKKYLEDNDSVSQEELEISSAQADEAAFAARADAEEIKSLKGLIREIEWERNIYLSTAGPRLRYRSHITPTQRARLEQETKENDNE